MDANCRRFSLLILVASLGVHCKSKEVKDPSNFVKQELRGAVASDHEQASKAGAAVLTAGGNAVDAAVVTALALGTVNPSSSGMGGGGFAIVYDASKKRTFAYDFREVGPTALTPAQFKVDGVLDPSLSQQGGLAVGVPGEVLGLEHMWSAHGKSDWQTLVQGVAALADGFYVSDFLARASSKVVEAMPNKSQLSKWLLPNKIVLRAKQKVSRPRLAKTLMEVAKHGSAGFYQGWVADDIVAATLAEGGVLSKADLLNYKVIEREVLTGSWKGLDFATMPMPSSGGILLLQMLGMLDEGAFDLAGMGSTSVDALHVITELLKHGFADRARLLGDNDGSSQWAARLLEPARLKSLASKIHMDKIGEHDDYGDASLASPSAVVDDKGTSHFCVIDKDGNAVALTTTVNGYFGSDIMAPKSGVVLNNEIDDFALEAGKANMFGLVQSEANIVGPGKRPLSSMTPTLVFKDGNVVGCFGGSGGPRIISNTFQAILNVFEFDMSAKEAVSAPRVHHQWLPDTIVAESAMTQSLEMTLKERGHEVKRSSNPTAVQGFVVRDGVVEAASDPRKGGKPAYTLE